MVKWISVKDQLPESCTRVLIVQKHGYMAVAMYVPILKAFTNEQHREIRAEYWAELPDIPKELQK